MMKIKICGIKNPDTAKACVAQGVDFIGVMMDPVSKRLIDTDQASTVIEAIKDAGGKAVLIPGDRAHDEVVKLCERLEPHGIQLNAPNYSVSPRLPEAVIRFFSVTIADNAPVFPVDSLFERSRDFLIFESHAPGKGVLFDEQHFVKPKLPFFIAGGLKPDNVAAIIEKYRPAGVDVSSGVEVIHGQKDLSLIQDFIQEARHAI